MIHHISHNCEYGEGDDDFLGVAYGVIHRQDKT